MLTSFWPTPESRETFILRKFHWKIYCNSIHYKKKSRNGFKRIVKLSFIQTFLPSPHYPGNEKASWNFHSSLDCHHLCSGNQAHSLWIAHLYISSDLNSPSHLLSQHPSNHIFWLYLEQNLHTKKVCVVSTEKKNEKDRNLVNLLKDSEDSPSTSSTAQCLMMLTTV